MPHIPPTASMTISAFATASRLSLKALRLCDESGLLPPERVDPDSGYRSYSAWQLPQARLIGLLRQLGLSLHDIRAVLDARADQQPDLLRAHWAQAEAQHLQRRDLAHHLIHSLTQTLTGEPTMNQQFKVQQRFVPAQQVATLSRRVYVSDLSGFIAEGMDTVFGLIASGGATVIGAPFVVYHGEVNTDNDGPVEVCVPYSGPLTPSGGLILRQEPAHAEAYVTLTKSQFQFPGILDAYDAASAYASAHGSASDLGPREVYPHAWDGLKGDDLAGDMAWPFVPQES